MFEKLKVMKILCITVLSYIFSLSANCQENKNSFNYKILKYHNPWLRDKKLDNPKNKKYEIEIPEEGYNQDLVYNN